MPELLEMKEQCMLQQVLNLSAKSQLKEMVGNREMDAGPLTTSPDGNGYMNFGMINR